MSKLIIGNWKMNGSMEKINHDLNFYKSNHATNKPGVVIALANIYLGVAQQHLTENFYIKIAAQDVGQYSGYGAYTGMTSANMLKEVGVSYVIIGHSERRKYLAETGNILVDKIKNTISCDMIPIFCVGESLNERSNKTYLNFIQSQLDELNNLPKDYTIIIAYEPCWSIGTGILPTCEDISEVVDFIYRHMQEKFAYAKITVLYGGSVNSHNAGNFLSITGIGGLLVGGMSLNIVDFSEICRNI